MYADGNKLKKEVYQNSSLTNTKIYAGSFVYNNNALEYALFDEGRLLASGGIFEYQYFLKVVAKRKSRFFGNHLGNTRVTFSGNTGSILQQDHYYPFGMNFSGIANAQAASIANQYKYNGKELQDDLIDGKKLNWYDYGSRFYDPQIGRWHVVDRFAEKYKGLTPYHYAANNPFLYIDINGDSISIAKEYREQYNKTLTDVFGDKAKKFSYTETGMLIYSGTEKDFKGGAKDVFSQFSSAMNESTTTNVIFEESTQITLNDGTKTTVKASDGGGALAVLVGENNVSQNTVLISPSAKTEFNIYAVTPAYYITPINAANGARFKETSVQSNQTDLTFHEFGHIINRGQSQDRVINFNNQVRKILGLKPRPYDETHNRNVIKGNY